MEIDKCVFPDNLLYDIDNLVWVKFNQDNEMLIGITPILTYISGKLLRIKIKEVGTYIDKGKSFASIESLKFFGTIKIPFSGIIMDKNNTLIAKPKIVNDSPYDEGWIIKIKPDSFSNNKEKLMSISEARYDFEKLITRFNVKCFKVFPDHEMFEIGTECAATLTKLGEFLKKIDKEETVHLVSDDPTADLELIRWTDQNNQDLIELRKEKNLFHFIIKKVR